MRFELEYKIPTKEEIEKDPNLENFDLNTYASFCISLIEQLKEKLDFKKEKLLKVEKEKEIEVLKYSIEMPVIRKKVIRSCPNVKPIIDKKLERPIVSIKQEGVGETCPNSENSVK